MLSLQPQLPPLTPLDPVLNTRSTPFPPPVLRHILSLLIPPPSFDRFASRSLQLRKFGLVSRAWHAVAQPELLAHPALRIKRGVRKFLKLLKEDPRTGETVQTLGIGSPDAGGEPMQLPLEIGELLGLCPNLEEVRLAAVWYLRWGSFQGCKSAFVLRFRSIKR